jgi:Bacterial EndoU nuclease
VAKYYVSPGRRVHILDGDLTGGGHRFGTGKAKSEFPRGWSDDEIIAAIVDVANDPASSILKTAKGRLKMIGNRNTVVIVVIVEPTSGEIITGRPW